MTFTKGTQVQRKSDNALGIVTAVYLDGRIDAKCDNEAVHEYAPDTFEYMFRRTGRVIIGSARTEPL